MALRKQIIKQGARGKVPNGEWNDMEHDKWDVGVEQKEKKEREEKALEERQRGNLLNDKSHIFKRNYKKKIQK